MSHITFVSWNVHGIRSQVKKHKVLQHIMKLKADICLLQETHLHKSEEKSLKDTNFNEISPHVIIIDKEESQFWSIKGYL